MSCPLHRSPHQQNLKLRWLCAHLNLPILQPLPQGGEVGTGRTRPFPIGKAESFTPPAALRRPPLKGEVGRSGAARRRSPDDGEAFGFGAARNRHRRAADPLDVALENAGGFRGVADFRASRMARWSWSVRASQVARQATKRKRAETAWRSSMTDKRRGMPQVETISRWKRRFASSQVRTSLASSASAAARSAAASTSGSDWARRGGVLALPAPRAFRRLLAPVSGRSLRRARRDGEC